MKHPHFISYLFHFEVKLNSKNYFRKTFDEKQNLEVNLFE